MTVSTTGLRITHQGNGATTAFAFPFRFLANSDLQVILIQADGTEVPQVINTNYTVAGAGVESGGTVTMLVAPASGEKLFIRRELELTQEIDYITGDRFPAETHEEALDRLTMIAQQVDETVARAVKVPETSEQDPNDLLIDLFAARDSAEADAAQTAADRVQTGLDRVQTGQDVITTGDNATLAQFWAGEAEATAESLVAVDSVSTIADLRATPGGAGVKVIVSGYYTPGDGGGGPLRVWKTDGPYVDNGGSIIVPTGGDGSGAWVWEWSGAVNVKWFGAKGDGAADDYTPIDKAIEHSTDLYFPEGTYLAAGLVARQNEAVTFRGVAGKSIIKKPNTTSGNVFSLLGGAKTFTFRDMVFDANFQNQTAQQNHRLLDYSFEGLEGTMRPADILIDNCEFRNIELTAFRYVGDSTGFANSKVVVRNSRFLGCQAGSSSFGPQFVAIANGGHALVDGCTFDSLLNVATDVTPPAVALSKRSTTSVPGSFIVTNNDIYRCGRGGAGVSDMLGAIEFYSDAASCVVSNNKLFNSNGRIITGKTDSGDCIISNNTCVNPNTLPQGIGILAAAAGSTLFTDTHNWIISGNIVKSTSGAAGAIRVEGRDQARRIMINNNIIKDFGISGTVTRGVFVSNANNVHIKDNIIDERTSVTDSTGIVLQDCGASCFLNGNYISAVDIGIAFNSSSSTEVMIIGNEFRSIDIYGILADGTRRIVVRSNNIFGTSSVGVNGMRIRDAAGKSPIRGNLIGGFTTAINILADPNNVYVQGENEV